VAKRIYTARINNGTSCDQVLETAGNPGSVSNPIFPDGCYQLNNDYFGIWVIPDLGCASADKTFEWSTPQVMACNEGKLRMTAELDLQNYDRKYWSAIEKTTPLIYDDIVSYPLTTFEDQGTFEVATPTCGPVGTQWTDSSGNPGYDNLGCVGKDNNHSYTMYRAYLANITNLGDVKRWCSIIKSTPGSPNGIYSFPSGCEIEGNLAYGIWILPSSTERCTNELVWKYMRKSCSNGTTKYVSKLTGLLDNLTDEQQLAIANVASLHEHASPCMFRAPDSVYKENCVVYGIWDGPSCNNNIDAEFLLIMLILILALIIILVYLVYIYWLRKN
jgi:hypothetical protein